MHLKTKLQIGSALRCKIDFLQNQSKKVSIVIPNFNGEKLLKDCIDSLYQINFPRDEFEIIVVDNSSSDNSKELVKSNYPDVVLIEADKNLGFAAGCNLGIKWSKGQYIVLLNNDTSVDKEWLNELVIVANNNSDVALVGSKLLYKDNPGVIQNAGSYLTDKGEGGDLGSHQADEGQYESTREVMAVCGASMLLKRTLIEEIGGLDEDFFAYYEDTDLCYRTKLHGKKIIYAPRSVVFHIHAATSGEWSPFFTFLVFRNKILLHLKNSHLALLIKVAFLYCRQIFIDGILRGSNRKTHLKVVTSIIQKFPKFLVKRFFIRFMLKKANDGNVLLRLTKIKPKIKACEVKRVSIYNAYLPTLGGGENQTAHIITYINSIFPSATIELLCHESEAFKKKNFFDKDYIKLLETEFGLSFRNTTMRFIDINTNQKNPFLRIWNNQKLSAITREYDLFINNTHISKLPGQAKVNIYYCMFPVKFERNRFPPIVLFRRFLNHSFLKSYDLFLANSQYTQKWIDNYWGVNSFVLYPPVRIDNHPINHFKENIIVNIGRFFVGGHNKKQDIMVQTFKNMYDKGLARGWTLVLAGRVHQEQESIRYVHALEESAKGYPIKFMFELTINELRSLLDKSKIYWHATGFGETTSVNPERFEHYGLSTIEAALFGVVPVVFKAGGQPEIIHQSENGFLWDTTDELIDFTELLMKNGELINELSKATFNSMSIFSEENQLHWLVHFLSTYFDFENMIYP